MLSSLPHFPAALSVPLISQIKVCSESPWWTPYLHLSNLWGGCESLKPKPLQYWFFIKMQKTVSLILCSTVQFVGRYSFQSQALGLPGCSITISLHIFHDFCLWSSTAVSLASFRSFCLIESIHFKYWHWIASVSSTSLMLGGDHSWWSSSDDCQGKFFIGIS